LKFCNKDPERQANKERNIWHTLYSSLPPVTKTVRIVEAMGHTALLMPWFQSPQRTSSTLKAVEKTLKEDYVGKGFYHDDVAWRNIGVYTDNGETKAVIFDMQSVVSDTEQKSDWVDAAVVASLSAKLI